MRAVGKEVAIKKATLFDIKFLNEMWAQKNTIFGTITDHPPSNSDLGNVFVAKLSNGEIVGVVHVSLGSVKGVSSAIIENLIVRPDMQLKGIGKKLLGQANAFLIGKKVRYARLKTSTHGEKFYPKTNWKSLKNKEYHYFWAPKKSVPKSKRPLKK